MWTYKLEAPISTSHPNSNTCILSSSQAAYFHMNTKHILDFFSQREGYFVSTLGYKEIEFSLFISKSQNVEFDELKPPYGFANSLKKDVKHFNHVKGLKSSKHPL